MTTILVVPPPKDFYPCAIIICVQAIGNYLLHTLTHSNSVWLIPIHSIPSSLSIYRHLLSLSLFTYLFIPHHLSDYHTPSNPIADYPHNSSHPSYTRLLLHMCLSTDCRKEGIIDHMVAFMKTYQTHTTPQQPPQPTLPIQSRKQQQQ